MEIFIKENIKMEKKKEKEKWYVKMEILLKENLKKENWMEKENIFIKKN